MLRRFGILLKKEPGFERFNDSVIRKLEAEGWKADRNLNVEHILISSAKTENCYNRESDLVKRLKQLLTPTQLGRCVVVELKREGRNKSSLDTGGHGI